MFTSHPDNSTSSREKSDEDGIRPHCRLPNVEDIAGVNENFETISDFMATMFKGLEEHATHTNENLTKMAQETNANLVALANDMRSIISSQTMLLTICVITISGVVLMVKSVYQAVAPFFQ